jgi:predicted DNA-binding antitoxin AbrB/MazE fold protein
MPQAITAVYENGVFIPRTTVTLPEHTTVKISISALPTQKKTRKSPAVLFDLAPGGATTDGSVNHDAYLYGEAPA